MAQHFADHLKDARRRSGLTQKELAERVGVDTSYISKLERGVYPPPNRNVVIAIAAALGMTAKPELLYFLLSASCASLEDLEGLDWTGEALEVSPDELTRSPMRVPHPKQLEEESLYQDLRHLLTKPGITPDQGVEQIRLLRSFVAWLDYRTASPQEE